MFPKFFYYLNVLEKRKGANNLKANCFKTQKFYLRYN